MSDSGRKLVSIIEAHRERSLGPFLRRLARASVTAGAFTLAACSGAAVTDAGGPGTDAGSSALDGSVSRVDAGPASSDAGPGTDAGPGLTDAAAADAGPGLTDAGPGPTDAAASDGGTIRYEAPLCDDSGNWLAVHDLATTRTPDYLDAADHQFIFYVVDSVGTACSGASDLDACNVALTAAESFFGRALRTTDGDVVERLASDVEVLGLLGSIDTKNEALLRAWLQGYTIGCSDPERWGVRVVDGGYEVLATRMVADCDPVIVNGYRLHVATDGTVTIVEMWELERTPGLCVGRRPEGLLDAPIERTDPVGGFFAEVARLEASAVCAFRTMAEELTHHGADAELISDALAAADDEARHAVSVGAIAARLGAAVEPAKVEASGVRDLFAIALENATEGCVRETFGALIGHHQALAAEDPEVRRAMAEIAQDETRHAALSWRVAQWVEPKLDEHERRRIAQARDEAIHELRTELSVEPDPALARIAGLPGAREAVAMLDTLRIALWAHA